MAWKLIARSETDGTAFEGVFSSQVWVFRAQTDVLGWNETQGKLDWSVHLKNDLATGRKCLVETVGVVCTFADYGYEKGGLLVGLDPKTGKVLWKNKTKVRPEHLTVAEGQIIVQGMNPELESDQARLLILNAASGKIESDNPSPWCNSMVCVQRRVFMAGEFGVWTMELGNTVWEQLSKEKGFALAADETGVYARLESGIGPQKQNAIVGWDVAALEEKGRIPFSVGRFIKIIPTGEWGRVAIICTNEAHGIYMIDLERGEILWHVGEEIGWRCTSLVWTPHNVVGLVKNNDFCEQVVCLREDTGALIDTVACLSSSSYVYWTGQRLLVTGLHGIESFQAE